MEAEEIEEDDVSVDENAPTKKEKEIERELDESFSIINFTSCTSDKLIEFHVRFNWWREIITLLCNILGMRKSSWRFSH